MLDTWVQSMDDANEAATNSEGYAESLQEKFEESFNGKLQGLSTAVEEFWISFYDNDQILWVIDRLTDVMNAITNISEALGPLGTSITAITGSKVLVSLLTGKYKDKGGILSTIVSALG